MQDSISVALIGLGRMGSAIARRILDAGFALTVHNRSAAKAAPLLDGGARWADSPRQAAAVADVVITCLMGDASVASATDGPAGILAGLRPGRIHLCATTISPEQAISLAATHSARGTSYLAGPVIGRPCAAATGQLVALTSGPDEIVERCRAVIATYAARIIKLGPQPGLANIAKLLTNYVAYASLELIGQVCAYAERVELPAEFAREMLAGMFAPALRQYIDRVAGRQYDDLEFDTYGGLKDLDLIAAATTAAATPLAYAGIIRDRLLAAIANGFGDH